jgi:hypothetical protein
MRLLLSVDESWPEICTKFAGKDGFQESRAQPYSTPFLSVFPVSTRLSECFSVKSRIVIGLARSGLKSGTSNGAEPHPEFRA